MFCMLKQQSTRKHTNIQNIQTQYKEKKRQDKTRQDKTTNNKQKKKEGNIQNFFNKMYHFSK